MKHLPNILTLANLFSGCIAIVFILNSQPYLTYIGTDTPYWVIGTEQAVYGAIFIIIAAFFDLLDGAAARALNIFSPIGKDLDSLADVVSFGVAPSMILFKMLWTSSIAQPNALDVSMWATAPAFLIPCFAALRLARFNTTTQVPFQFIGMPVPAIGILIASFPFINLYEPSIGLMFKHTWVLYIIIILCCWLMISKISFFKLVPKAWTIKNMWAQIVLVVALVLLYFLIGFASIPIVFLLYILLSFIYKVPISNKE